MSRESRAWRDGARAAIAGHAFAMNPYSPGPKPKSFPRTDPRGKAWADGYWWAKRNRSPDSEPENQP